MKVGGTGPLRVVGLLRASTRDQAENGVSFDQQRDAIEHAARCRGWQIVTILDEQASGAAKQRPVRDAAVALVESGGADALVASKLDRLSRSVVDFGTLVERAAANNWTLLVLDMDLDTGTPVGRMLAHMVSVFAAFERETISARTVAALAVKRSQGVKLGRPSTLPADVELRIKAARAAGQSWQAIADQLNEDAIPTPAGGRRWYPTGTRRVALR